MNEKVKVWHGKSVKSDGEQSIESRFCKPNGKIRAKKPPSIQCTIEDGPKLLQRRQDGLIRKVFQVYRYTYGNGNFIKVKVVNECDSTIGCDAKDGYYPPYRSNIAVASKAVWKALDVPLNQ
ncbi:hypothetical protein J1N35_028607 [Gossypium stocksii]|uniref:Uncharacterized protein n=1 Tax=Gossypium stocksii TaxID=47602 RepID=A0A9D3UWP1_9ROSI|nr:hypothetical protein J1N35_028607 [Gossypium stocksii]